MKSGISRYPVGPYPMADPVWALVMFDLPVRTKVQRRMATQYRNMLLDNGFSPVQLSVYCKYMTNASGIRRLVKELKKIPPNGRVQVLRLTDEQWASTMRFEGPREVKRGQVPSQLLLFSDENNEETDQQSEFPPW